MLNNTQLDKYKQNLLADFNSRTHYDRGRFHAPVAHRLIEFAQLQPGQTVLDIATGTGLVALAAAKKVGIEGKVVGVDISTGMLEQARQKQINLGLQNVEFIEADVEIVEFSDRSFDVIFCSLAICYLTDISPALKKWHEWLKQNGTLALNVWAEKAFPPSVLFREVAQRYGINIPNPNEPFGTLKKCYRLLQTAGFKSIQVIQEQFGWYFTPDFKSAEELWQINSKNVFGSQVFELSADELARCKAEYMAEVQALPTTEQGAWCDASIFFVIAHR
ncbi:methyltransferase domain-containing protein [Scytonema sp. UIC 10036]|uniref:class I SAM-dependent methyltransferase n=1 Tax=Scytonema sp. UIC 10036 TaxID=2304196 RepID=UPI0012DA4FB8|nr:methyltransferase domain-containing protein [Scytonema sp. UIC 10036]MUG93896.1 methyltransferase domain-containing protein [Scytonema sp. UIC 10036]